MDIKLNLGATVDVASGKEVAEVGRGIVSELRRTIQDDRIKSLDKPIRRRAIATGAPVTGQVVLLDLGTPAQGRYWSINNLMVFDSTFTVLTGVTAALGIGDEVNRGNMDAVHFFPQVAGSQNFSSRTIDVPYGDYVYVAVFGAPTSANSLVAAMRYSDYPDYAIAPAAV